jgi:hypothetical protein
VTASAEEHVAVIGAIEDYDPPAVSLVRQPARHKLRYIGLRLPPAWELDGIGNRLEPFLDACLCAGMDPEHPSIRLLCRCSVRVFDGQLRFAHAAEAYEGHAASRLGASLVDLVESVSTVDEVGVAGKRDCRERLRRCFWSF